VVPLFSLFLPKYISVSSVPSVAIIYFILCGLCVLSGETQQFTPKRAEIPRFSVNFGVWLNMYVRFSYWAWRPRSSAVLRLSKGSAVLRLSKGSAVLRLSKGSPALRLSMGNVRPKTALVIERFDQFLTIAFRLYHITTVRQLFFRSFSSRQYGDFIP